MAYSVHGMSCRGGGKGPVWEEYPVLALSSGSIPIPPLLTQEGPGTRTWGTLHAHASHSYMVCIP